jgi:hypothetical protein
MITLCVQGLRSLPPAPLSTGNCSTGDLENRRLLIGCVLEGTNFHFKKRDLEILEAPSLESRASVLVIHGAFWTRLGTPVGPDLYLNDLHSPWGPLWGQFGSSFGIFDIGIGDAIRKMSKRFCKEM